LKINELKQGDYITQQVDNFTIALEVVSIKKIGRRFMVTFSSVFGIETASYQGDAYITAS
jgi:hypothetical protein